MLKDQELFNVQREAEIATRKAKFYKDTLAELAMFKSKTDVALLQAQERLSMDTTEADSLEKRYNDAYQGAQKQFEEGMRLRDAVQQVTAMANDTYTIQRKSLSSEQPTHRLSHRHVTRGSSGQPSSRSWRRTSHS